MTTTSPAATPDATPDAAPRGSAAPRTPAGVTPDATPVPSRSARRLSLGLGLVTLVGAVPTVLDPGLLRGPAAMNGSARGTALVMAAVAVPLLALATRAAARGSLRAWPLWLGSCAYLLYNAVMLLVGTPFNHAFLAYDATLGLAVWTIIAALHDLDAEAFAAPLRSTLPARPIAVYTWVIAGLNALLWLKGAVPASLEHGTPGILEGTGMTTMPTYLQDLAFWLPATAVGAWWLWRRATWGYLVVSSCLTMWVLESLGIAVDQFWGHLADPSSTVVAPQMVPVFAVLAVVGLVPVAPFLRRLPGTPRTGTPRAR